MKSGVAALRAHNLALSDMLIEAARDLGLPLVSPQDPNQRGGSVMLKAQSPDHAANMVSAAKRKQIYLDHRGAVLRLSPGISTTTADVEILISTLHSIL
jgi:selenocysteine lyase/cysteine desulfurase